MEFELNNCYCFFITTLDRSLGFLNGGSKENGQNPVTMEAETVKTQTSTAKFLWAAQGKRFKKIQTWIFPEPQKPSETSRTLQEPSGLCRNLQEPSGTFRTLQAPSDPCRNLPWDFPEPSLRLKSQIADWSKSAIEHDF